jgi:hypothetical protein
MPGGWSNASTLSLERWQKPGDNARFQRYTSGYQREGEEAFYRYQYSDARLIDASFARLTNASLSWQMPESWAQKARVSTCRLFINAQNLVTITNYEGADPESRFIGTPPLRVLSGGIQLSL